MFCSKCGKPLEAGQTVCSECGAGLSVNTPAPINRPMKWYKALIYFILFLSAFTYALEAVKHLFFSGMAPYYKSIPLFLVADIAFGIWAVAIVVLSLVARSSLARFKKNGPTMILTYYAVAAIYEIADQIVEWIGSATPINILSLGIGIGLNVLIFMLHRTYFKKREHLFVN